MKNFINTVGVGQNLCGNHYYFTFMLVTLLNGNCMKNKTFLHAIYSLYHNEMSLSLILGKLQSKEFVTSNKTFRLPD